MYQMPFATAPVSTAGRTAQSIRAQTDAGDTNSGQNIDESTQLAAEA
jgi:hypothetical protein